jgi:hypothetical protein
MNSIGQITESITTGLKSATRYMPEPVAKGLDLIQSLGRTGAIDTSAIPSDTKDLIDRQIQLQQEMLQVTLFTNLERTRHETQMAPARNIRLS